MKQDIAGCTINNFLHRPIIKVRPTRNVINAWNTKVSSFGTTWDSLLPITSTPTLPNSHGVQIVYQIVANHRYDSLLSLDGISDYSIRTQEIRGRGRDGRGSFGTTPPPPPPAFSRVRCGVPPKWMKIDRCRDPEITIPLPYTLDVLRDRINGCNWLRSIGLPMISSLKREEEPPSTPLSLIATNPLKTFILSVSACDKINQRRSAMINEQSIVMRGKGREWIDRVLYQSVFRDWFTPICVNEWREKERERKERWQSHISPNEHNSQRSQEVIRKYEPLFVLPYLSSVRERKRQTIQILGDMISVATCIANFSISRVRPLAN